ncbi:uncharacterized protein LOC110252832 [Exaiptasia diaphana]|uniref:Uncharacterized protein n=1 Tax=Exaiptasia diaphana TaxID=2652724 RepID=A0A913Y591_EXADI|nr:uncharacterized protein LOC110252832 [Exaiptasia diaphana]KXJ22211.1 hypothetical protein AC249_AIPGENE22208 [Exaiptasia diaphana]
MSEEVEPPPKRSRNANSELEKIKRPDKETFLRELNNINKEISSLLSDANNDFLKCPEKFLSDTVRNLGKLIGFYRNLFCKTEVETRKELDGKIGQLCGDKEVQESAELLMEKEVEWDGFLEDVDKKLNYGEGFEEELTAGDAAPCDLMLTDVRNESKYSLGELLEKAATSNIVLILLRHFA